MSLANIQVEWSEINAAWGQTLLLIATVAEKLNFQFEVYLSHPTFSQISHQNPPIPPTVPTPRGY